jgi:hypothetical protein
VNKIRRLPGPADSRLSEGDHSPEALYELFRDWQKTQTQSSVTALRSLRQQMDVWFCRAQEPMPRGIFCVLNILELLTCTLSRACPKHPCLRLTDDLHGGRLLGNLARARWCGLTFPERAVIRPLTELTDISFCTTSTVESFRRLAKSGQPVTTDGYSSIRYLKGEGSPGCAGAGWAAALVSFIEETFRTRCSPVSTPCRWVILPVTITRAFSNFSNCSVLR